MSEPVSTLNIVALTCSAPGVFINGMVISTDSHGIVRLFLTEGCGEAIALRGSYTMSAESFVRFKDLFAEKAKEFDVSRVKN